MSDRQKELDKFINTVFGFSNDDEYGYSHFDFSYPPHDIYVINNELLVFDFAIAGCDIEKVSISIQNDNLNVKYEKDKTNPTNIQYIKNKIAKRDFNIVAKIPAGYSLNESDILANYKNGILSIRIPQTAKSQETIKININK